MALQEEFIEQGNFLFKHRSYLPIVIILLGLCVFVQTELAKFGNPDFVEFRYLDVLCFSTCLFGLLIRVLSIGYSSDNTSGRNTTDGQIADSVNSTGMYSICRHPLYVGNFFMWLGIAGFTQNLWFIVAFVFMYWLYYERIMYAEEAFLRNKYGEGYLNWANRTPAFIPRLSKWKSPENKFSWVKIIRQEKAGILNLFLVVFIFKAIGAYISKNSLWEAERFWLIGLGLSLLWYIIIKTIQKTTNLLSEDR